MPKYKHEAQASGSREQTPTCLRFVLVLSEHNHRDRSLDILHLTFRIPYMTKPTVGITMGDPAGCGPETIAAALADPRVRAACRPIVVGNVEVLRRAAAIVDANIEVADISRPEEATDREQTIHCIAAGSPSTENVLPRTIDPVGGQAAYDALEVATSLALAGQVDAVTTAPLHKVALERAGHPEPGHTEILARLCGVDDFAMMLYLPANSRGAGDTGILPVRQEEHWRDASGTPCGLGVVHVTLHMALRDVFEHVTEAAIVAKGRLLDAAMQLLAPGTEPRLAVAALNPHAGEEGLFGSEEQSIIAPAVARLQQQGLNIAGPLPADTLMIRARNGEFTGVVAMYHDQGHIALKLLDMHRAVNITLGLPIIRTSVAHGTAFDLAWRGQANHQSMVEAICTAAQLVNSRAATDIAATNA